MVALSETMDEGCTRAAIRPASILMVRLFFPGARRRLCQRTGRPASASAGDVGELRGASLHCLSRELVSTLVERNAGVPGHINDAVVTPIREGGLHARDELLVGLGFPALREHANGILAVGVEHE